MKIKRTTLIIIFTIFSSVSFADLNMTTEQNDRAIELYKETRCLVCQSQTIYDSNSELATDLKLFIQEEIISGKSDDEIKTQLVNNYGEWTLMTPTFSKANYILWFGPFIFLLFGIVPMYKYIIKKNNRGS